MFTFAPDSHTVLVTRILHYVSIKFEVSVAFRFRVRLNRRQGKDRRSDGLQATLCRPSTSVGYTAARPPLAARRRTTTTHADSL